MKEGKLLSAFAFGLLTLLTFAMPVMSGANSAEMWEIGIEELSEAVISERGFFMENIGQWDPSIRFVGETSFGHIGVGNDGVYFNIVNDPGKRSEGPNDLSRPTDDGLGIEEQKASGHVLKYEFQGSNDLVPVGSQRTDHKVSFFLGNDPSRWVTDVPCYREVLIPDLWQNIDLRYYFGEKGPKYDLILSPGADPGLIGVKVLGAQDIGISKSMVSIQSLEGPVLSDSELKVHYDGNEEGIISSGFSNLGNGGFGFELGRYDKSRTVVIDPLIFSTFIGGSLTEYSNSVVSNSNGDIYVGGHSFSTDFPTTPGAYSSTDPSSYGDLTVFCLDPTGSQLKYSSYIGGGYADYFDEMTLDQNEDPIFVAHTLSTDFPVSTGVYQTSNAGSMDLVIVRMKKDLSGILKATYLGGWSYENEGRIHLHDGEVYIACETSSTNYPTTSGAFDTTVSGYRDFAISRLSGDLSELRSSTYLGGNSYEYLGDLTVDPEGNPIIIGETYSTDYVATEGAYSTTMSGYADIVITSVDSTAKDLIFSTFLGGTNADHGTAIELASQNEIVVSGYTSSMDFPTQSTSYQQNSIGGNEVFFAVLDHNASSLLRSTLLGGSSYDLNPTMAIDDIGDVHFCFPTASEDLPFSDSALQDSFMGGWYDLFFGTFSSNLSYLVYGSYLGGSDRDYVNQITIDPTGNTIIVGDTNSDDFPISESALYDTITGDNDTFVFKFSILPNSDPLEVHSVKLFSDPDLTDQIIISDIGETVHIELRGIGANDSRVEYAVVNISFERSMDTIVKAALLETSVDSGIYKGTFRIPGSSRYFEKVTFTSRKDQTRKAVLTLDKPNRPSQVHQVGLFNDAAFSNPAEVADRNETVYIRVLGTDSDPSTANIAFVNVSSQNTFIDPFLVFLTETGINTGIYTGTFKVPVEVPYLEDLFFTSVRNPLLSVKIMVSTHVLISPIEDITLTVEDVLYSVQYENKGWSQEVTWTFHTDVEWLTFDQGTRVLSGTPGNDDIGKAEVWLTLRDDKSHKDEHNFIIEVMNSLPSLEWGEDTETLQDEEYNVNFESDDETVGTSEYHLSTNASWLTLDPVFGILSGTPTNDEVGTYFVKVWIDDGNGGKNTTTFELTVRNINDPPKIVTTDIARISQGDPYRRDYDSVDIDRGDVHTWTLLSPDFLSIGRSSGILSGTPSLEDIGRCVLEVHLSDGKGGKAQYSSVMEIRSPTGGPIIVSYPDPPVIISEDVEYNYQLEARSPDAPLIWKLPASPSFLSVDVSSGILSGTPGNDDIGMHTVRVQVSDPDGQVDEVSFEIEVRNVNDPPYITTSGLEDAVEGMEYHFEMSCIDIDPVSKDPLWSIQKGPSFLRIDNRTGVLSGIPADPDTGVHIVLVRVDDGDGGMDIKLLRLEVIDVNSPPVVLDYEPVITLYEDSSAEIDLASIFMDPDGPSLFYSVSSSLNVECVLLSDLLTLTPVHDWSGEELISMEVSDGEFLIRTDLLMKVLPVNDAPIDVEMIVPSDLKEGSEHIFRGSATDVDIPCGDSLIFMWFVDGELLEVGDKAEFSLDAGRHEITLSVRDREGASNMTSKMVFVQKVDTDERGIDRDLWQLLMMSTVLIAAIFALIVIVAIYRRSGKI
ncbi:MAG: putative Ig domain-containing protein [Thermoplasmatota archaeon]